MHKTLWIAGVAVTLAWGAGAFGANYPWAYQPLLAACAALGAAGLLFGRNTLPTSVLVGLALIAGVAALQALPLPPSIVEQITPASAALQRQQNLLLEVDRSRPLTLSIEPARTHLGLAFVASFGLLLAGCARMLTRNTTRQLAGAIAVLGVVIALVGIVQYGTFTTKIYGFWEPIQRGTPFGPFVNKNHFAGWTLMALPVAIGLFASYVSRGMRGVRPTLRDRFVWFSSADASKAMLLAFGILTMALALVLTMSRSGMISLAVAFLIAAVAMARRQSTTSRRVVVAAYLAVVTLLVVSWVGMARIVTRFAEVDGLSVNRRPAIWADTLRIARDFWVTGTGLNTYGVSTLYYQTSVPSYHLREAHNDYLQLASEGGLLLGVPIILTIAAFVWAVRRRLRQDVGSIWWLRMGAVTGLVAIAVQSVVEFSLQMPGNAALFAVLCGIALHDGRTTRFLDEGS